MSVSLSLREIAPRLDGTAHGDEVRLSTFNTDTRTLQVGDTFIALSGPNHDAHDFCARAAAQGANALIVERAVAVALPQLVVPDARLALGKLAHLWCGQFQVPLIAVTGSNGKTTVKEMLAAILRQLGPVLSTEGNLNNDIGLPLTLLRMREEHQYAVVEMGANHVGEIGYLSQLAQPDVALITNVSSAHLQGFGSIGRIAKAKSEIFQGLSRDGFAIVNIDDDFASVMLQAAAGRTIVTFGLSERADVRGGFVSEVFSIRLRGTLLQPDLKLLGQHNRLNAVAAAAAASCLDVQPETIRTGLESVQPVAGRLQRRVNRAGMLVIDDTYNANPASTRAAINVLAEQRGERVLVLGDMLELGDDEVRLHTEIGIAARDVGIERVYTVGPLAAHAAHAFGVNGVSFASKEQLLQTLLQHHARATTVLVKGSRGSRMEDVVDGLMHSRAGVPRPEARLT